MPYGGLSYISALTTAGARRLRRQQPLERNLIPTPVSCYILTCNSAARLEQVLSSLDGVADDLVILGSGSTDDTAGIAGRFGVRVLHRPFDAFTAQRTFAVSQCLHDWILTVDSDEVLSPDLARRLHGLKRTGLSTRAAAPSVYAIRRGWYVMQQRVRCFYPSRCPDYIVRLFRRDKAVYLADRQVHESMIGFTRAERLDEALLHYICDSIDQIYGKVNLYTTLAACGLRRHGRPSLLRVFVMPWLIWFR